jgi:aryl-alcohol dehydrogenase-like predicted oxidoreductase
VPIEETLRALDDLVSAGKILYYGTSNFAPWQIMEALWVGSELRLHQVVSEQAPYSMVCRAAERFLLPMARKHHLAVLAWSPLWGGLLTGKYQLGAPHPVGSRFALDLPLWSIWKDHLLPSAFDLIGQLQGIARRRGRSVSQIALGWALGQPGITSLVIGPRTLEQLDDNLAALIVSLEEDDLSLIDQYAPPGGALVRPRPA